ncbi:MAG TPA: trimethylamine methyltransferase family protein [Candidatus Lokiarchaeia archaeon]|nr:trimethylamine methyltransferase family protein [Candidatus Lokiarchaeia archaeon]
MKSSRFEVLSSDEIRSIHDSSMHILTRIGLKIEYDEARTLLAENGATIKDDGVTVLLTPELVDEMLARVPASFSMSGPDGTFKFDVSTEGTIFASQGSPTKVFDEQDPRMPRDATLDDFVKYIRIMDSLQYISSTHLDVWPVDMPYEDMHVRTMTEWGKWSRKPFGMGCRGRAMSQDLMNLARIIIGDQDDLETNPRLIAFYNPISPLRLPHDLTEGLMVFADNKQPIIIAPAACGGTTAPVTIAGLLAQTNAEILATLVVAQLRSPGSPVLYGCVNSVMDPYTANVAWGSVETGLITAAAAQLARHYNIPSRAAGAITNANQFDMQNGIERFMTLFAAASAGINYITCAGTYASILASSLELLEIDDDLAGIMLRWKDGIAVNDETLALDQIETIANTPSKAFLTLKHTRTYARKEIFVPPLSTRLSVDSWIAKGMPSLLENARARVREVLSRDDAPRLSQETMDRLARYIKEK